MLFHSQTVHSHLILTLSGSFFFPSCSITVMFMELDKIYVGSIAVLRVNINTGPLNTIQAKYCDIFHELKMSEMLILGKYAHSAFLNLFGYISCVLLW